MLHVTPGIFLRQSGNSYAFTLCADTRTKENPVMCLYFNHVSIDLNTITFLLKLLLIS